MRGSNAVPALKVARNELGRWGGWWCHREDAECYQGGTSLSAIMMEICRLGVRVQTTNTSAHMHLSDSIRVPGWVEDMDERVGRLPLQQRNALVLWYVRRDRRAADSLPLLRAELAIGDILVDEWGGHVPAWATG